MPTPPFLFIVAAVVMSVFYARWNVATIRKQEARSTAASIHDAWISLVGSIFGWSAMWLLIHRVNTRDFDIWVVVLLFLAFSGVTGFLSRMIADICLIPSRLGESWRTRSTTGVSAEAKDMAPAAKANAEVAVDSKMRGDVGTSEVATTSTTKASPPAA